MFTSKKRKFNRISMKIKEIKIQGARNIAKAALKAYSLIPTKQSRKTLISLRPTEPMLQKVLELTEKQTPNQIRKHFDFAQAKINSAIFKTIKKQDVIFTHCHSTNVTNSLISAKKRGKNFEVYNTETRPLYQGRKTSKELKKAGINVTQFVDSALGVALSKEQGTKKVNRVFLGADAITKKGVVNKIGSEVIARIAKEEKIPVYIIADSWKFTKKNLPLEQRKLNEIWDNAPKKIKIKNPAFEFIDKKYINAIVSEYGVLSYEKFLKKV
jgi:translation initiation factor 2B subunit (eIF-2B alpha/beta/delta family)